MAKTYEALSKAEESHSGDPGLSSNLTKWRCPDLTNKKELSDLLQKITIDVQKNGLKIFHFASNRKGEGTSTVVVNLANLIMDAKSFNYVLLIDANRERPVLHQAFNVASSPGLNEILMEKIEYSEAVKKIGSSDIYVMPNGTKSASKSSNIEQKKFSSFVSKIRDQYELIIIDSPPLLTSSDSLSLANCADSTYLVVQAHNTQWEVVEQTKNYLNEYKRLIGGVILNRVQQSIPSWIYKRL
ncbi:MAG: CpsD/CapB family tyrosine-protein kinase [Proteobacteria bacterium]|nr:CpsD/CapB family tyrosine-protein kinase [Actinomycetota bacterium]MBU4288007.1 CpsD/CapB family tyrosine-protein kinase [Pseudomonadota bacterium]